MQVSLVIARTVEGELKLLYFGEDSDAALDLHAQLKQSRGRNEKGKRFYTDSVLFLRPRSNRKLHFAE